MKPLEKLMNLTTSEKSGFKSEGYYSKEDMRYEFIVRYNDNEILKQTTEGGLIEEDAGEAMFVGQVISRLVNMGLQAQLKESEK